MIVGLLKLRWSLKAGLSTHPPWTPAAGVVGAPVTLAGSGSLAPFVRLINAGRP